jgi:predicted nucleic acid-binding protein
MTDLGLLDSNVFIHALHRRDPLRVRAQAIIAGLETGMDQGWLDPLVVHELLYTLSHLRLFATPQELYAYVRSIILMTGIECEHKDWLLDSLERWHAAPVSFVDAWLWVQARQRRQPVCTVNGRDFPGVRISFDAP